MQLDRFGLVGVTHCPAIVRVLNVKYVSHKTFWMTSRWITTEWDWWDVSNKAWLELACEEIGGIVDWEIKSFGYISPEPPTLLCERGAAFAGYLWQEIPCEEFVVCVSNIKTIIPENRKSKIQFEEQSAELLTWYNHNYCLCFQWSECNSLVLSLHTSPKGDLSSLRTIRCMNKSLCACH